MYQFKRIFTGVLALSIVATLSGCTSSGASSSAPISSAAPAASTASSASAADSTSTYPEKDIQVIVTAEAGGGTDAVARAITVPLEQQIGKPLVVVNKGAAGGMVGMTEIFKAVPDGYTLGVFSNTDVANFVFSDTKTEFGVEDFTYIAGLNSTGDILLMKKDSPYKTLADFIAAAKEKPGSFTIGLPSPIQKLSLNLLNAELEIETTGVVYEGGGKVFADLLGGHIDAGILSAKFISQAKEQGVDVFGLMLDERLSTFPDTPTFVEQGYNIVNPAVRMLVGPKGLPQEVIDRLTEELKTGYGGQVSESLKVIGEAPVLRTYEELQPYLESDFAMRKAQLVK